MIRWIIENSYEHPLKNLKILLSSTNPCAACSQGKFITKPSSSKVLIEASSVLEKIQEIYVGLFIHHGDLLNIL